MGDIPPLGGLSVNAPPGPPPTSVRDLPPELTEEVLASYLARLELEELCEANLLQICMALRGTNQCNDPDDPLWEAACARFGLTERVVGGTPDAPATPTWHVTFLAMCKELAMMEPEHRATYMGLLRGDDAYEDGPFSGDDDSEDDDADEEATPQMPIRIAVVQLWNHAASDGLLCVIHSLLRRVDGIVHDDGDVGAAPRGLQLASANGHVAVVELLLAHDADVHAEGDDALHLASTNGHAAVVEILLEHGAYVHADNEWALFQASANGHAAVAEVLLARGADVHADNDAALIEASRNGHAAAVEVLLAHDADFRASDGWALTVASDKGNLAVVKVLLAHGADVHASNDAALRAASRRGHVAVVEFLRAHGATAPF